MGFLVLLEGEDLSIGTPTFNPPLDNGLVPASELDIVELDVLKKGGLSIDACNIYLCLGKDDLADPYF